jgi:hypothetical protein
MEWQALGFELRALHLQTKYSTTPKPLLLSDRALYPELASDHDPPTSSSFVAGITDMNHYTWLVL